MLRSLQYMVQLKNIIKTPNVELTNMCQNKTFSLRYLHSIQLVSVCKRCRNSIQFKQKYLIYMVPKSHEILMLVSLQKDDKRCCDATKLIGLFSFMTQLPNQKGVAFILHQRAHRPTSKQSQGFLTESHQYQRTAWHFKQTQNLYVNVASYSQVSGSCVECPISSSWVCGFLRWVLDLAT